MFQRIPATLLKIIDESPDIKTFIFSGELKTKPGNFVMLTDYLNGEKPFSFSAVNKDSFELTVKVHGKFTQGMFSAKVSDTYYYSGPHGNSFTYPNSADARILIAGGGVGTAPMKYLLNDLLQNGYKNIDLVNGARNSAGLLYSTFFSSQLNSRYYKVTDDGSEGGRMFVHQKMIELAKQHPYEMVYIAGPELMMKAALDEMKEIGVQTEFLLERYMKCGIGICGQCTLDPLGIRLCIEGPVVDKLVVEQSTEFGVYHRDAYGAKVPFRT